MRILAVVLSAAFGFATPAAHAEKADREKEIVIGADHLTADDANRTSTFDGTVVVTQGTMRITANKVTVKEDADRHKYYVAHGAPVTFRQKRDNTDDWIEGFAERVEFDDRNDVLKLFNRARVKRNSDELTGDVITYDMKKELAEITGAPAGRSSAGAPPGRVKAVILPPKKAPEPGKGAAAEKVAPAAGIALKPDDGIQ
jgi:lipopolysaccharide export system protein LptA